jgi:hypothetical protein
MSVADNFKSFCDKLIQKDVSYHYNRITKRFNLDFRGLDSETVYSLYIGSHGRRTATSKTSDIDMLYQLPSSLYEKYNSYTGNGQSALLQAVRESLRKTYSTSSIGADGQVVVVSFEDDVTFEILPAFANVNGNFTYPDSNNGGSWKTTDPKPEIQAIRNRDDEYNSNLRRLCRMARIWKTENNVPIKGLLIDTLAYQFIGQWAYNDKSYLYYDWMMRDFFFFLFNQDSNKSYWLAPGSGRYVYRTGPFEYHAKRAYNSAVDAIQYESEGKQYSAKIAWQEIFGTIYP